CCADPTRYADALDVLAGRDLRGRVPAAVIRHLEAGVRGVHAETPKPGDAALARVRHMILASNRTALDAAEQAARRGGAHPIRVPSRLAGEASLVGRRLGALARVLRADSPKCLLAGGETTVRLRGDGRGGRSQELALAAALELAGARDVALLA